MLVQTKIWSIATFRIVEFLINQVLLYSAGSIALLLMYLI
jgi:hypothetical protein